MDRLFLCLAFLSIVEISHSQHLYFEGLSGMTKSDYSTSLFSKTETYYQLGGRFGFGADHFQIGGEYRLNITDPVFLDGIDQLEFSENYFGAFLRTKISKYPAKRFGLVIMAGAGYYTTSLNVTGSNPSQQLDYERILGINGGGGFSMPVIAKTMLEFGYRYNYFERPGITDAKLQIESHRASYHSFQMGLSYNLVFGKRAKEYELLERKSRSN